MGGQLWVRLAFGTHSRLCPIDPNFRVIVIVEKNDAYTRLAPPLLNRFEKQVMDRSTMMEERHLRLQERLRAFLGAFTAHYDAGASSPSSQSVVQRANTVKASLCGYYSGLLSSLALSIVGEARPVLGSWVVCKGPPRLE